MAQLTIQQATVAGVAVTLGAVSASDKFKNNGRTSLRIKNDGTGATTVTISRKTCSYGFTHDLTATVANGGEKTFGPFPTEQFNDDNGDVTVSCNPTTSVTAAAVSL